MTRVQVLSQRERMFRRVGKVLVAVSGGADSMACLVILRELGRSSGFTVEACHFDHKLRANSGDDLDAVRTMCAGLGVECITGEGDVAAVAAQMRRGMEDAAREMRYQFLAFVAEKQGSDCIATGHTANDQAETILMHIIRGSGVRGIRGMLPVSEVPGSEAQRLIRPLLECSRGETEAICAEHGITPLIDPSNEDERFTRNQVRKQLLPVLERFNPSATEALIGLGESAREAFAPIERRSFEVQPIERGPIGALFALAAFDGVPAEALGLIIEREATFHHLSPETNRTRVKNLQEVLASGSGSVLFGDTEVEASCGFVRLGPPLETVAPFAPAVLDVPGVTRAGPGQALVRTDSIEATPSAPVAAIDSKVCSGTLRIRPAEAGDRITWHGIERKVSDLLINEKVPVWERAGMVAISDALGVVALFAAKRIFVRDGGEPDLWIRLSAVPR
ncbi:MAG: tRNA lysidine(34) synthetase TilS [Dehalococcoidia bacterium]|nr:tRNA lysidine(34) synthetase TilS [Dehalococcoidia bacterium]